MITGVARAAIAAVAAMALSGCLSLSPLQQERAQAIADAGQSTQLSCAPDSQTRCSTPSPLRALAVQAEQASTVAAPRHYALLLDYGQDALLARINLLRSATTSIDVQTYIFAEDDAGHLMLEELLAAARRGVRVRLLIDQLSALERVRTLAALAAVHRNFELRIYNPVLRRARLGYPQYAVAAACCWKTLNRRMHSKLLMVDGAVGITGGRNYQDMYYDWDPDYNFRDRDVLLAGPEVQAMRASFETFWMHPRSVRVATLTDVGRYLLRNGAPALADVQYRQPERVAGMREAAADQQMLADWTQAMVHRVGAVDFLADRPADRDGGPDAVASLRMQDLIRDSQKEVVLQTPYLVLSEAAQAVFGDLRERAAPPTVTISTNSLAATDSFITYALSYKYRRRQLRDLGFRIHEYKPFPLDPPMDIDALMGDAQDTRQARAAARAMQRRPLQRESALSLFGGSRSRNPVPLQRAGLRAGLHAKSMVIDGRVGVVGTHNFDPRGDSYNTENLLIVDDAAFAAELRASIARDMAPENSWTVARRDTSPILPGVEYTLAKWSERLPILDLWPTRYATNYAFAPGPGCATPPPPDASTFRQCHHPVGDFPEVSISARALLTRIFTAFGAGLAPIL